MVLRKIIVSLLLLVCIDVSAQCDYTQISSLPYTETFCHEQGDCNFVQNDYPISNQVFGCWTCLNNPHYYVITPEVDTYVVLDIYPTLFSHLASNTEPQVPGFVLFDGCPNNGGETLFRPWAYSSGACWDWGVLDVYCGWSQSSNSPNLNQGCVTSTPAYTGMAHEVTMGFQLEAGEEYWFCVFPQGGCPPWTNTCNWGCIDVSFSGVTLLELVSTPPQDLSTPPKDVSAPPRFQKLHIPNSGIVIKDTYTGHMYNILMQRLTDSE